MAIEVFRRHENKYLINEETYKTICMELCNHMELDQYNKAHPFYTISNIYYDTSDNQLIRNSLSKPIYKEKLRLRAYGIPSSGDKVFLEIKKKVNGIVYKRRTKLVLEEAYEFLDTCEKPQIMKYMNHQVMNEIEYFLKLYRLIPKLYLAYDRKAYFGINNRDLRITFDTNIRSRREDLRLELGDYGEQLLDSQGYLMEIKAEKCVPIWLVKLLSENKVYRRSFSKYGTEYKAMLKNKLETREKQCLIKY